MLARAVHLLSFLALLAIAGCASRRTTVPLGTIPPAPTITAEDRFAAEEAVEEVLSEFPVENDATIVGRVGRVVDRLLAAIESDGGWKTFVLRNEDANAFTTQGRVIFVFTGLLDIVKSDDELAGVLAHEIGHTLAGHVQPDTAETVNQMIAATASAVTAGALSEDPANGANAGLTAAIVEGLIINPQSQKLELEADDIGIFLMAKAGFAPEGMVEFWRRYLGIETGEVEFFSTHPGTKSRLEHLEMLLELVREKYPLKAEDQK